MTGLHLAAKEGHVDVVSELVKRGSRVDAATRVRVVYEHVRSFLFPALLINSAGGRR